MDLALPMTEVPAAVPLPAATEGAGMVMICMIRSFARFRTAVFIGGMGIAGFAVGAVRNLAASYKILPQPNS